MQTISKSTFYNPLNQIRSKSKHMTSKKQLYENRHTLPVLGQENLKQVLFFTVTMIEIIDYWESEIKMQG